MYLNCKITTIHFILIMIIILTKLDKLTYFFYVITELKKRLKKVRLIKFKIIYIFKFMKLLFNGQKTEL